MSVAAAALLTTTLLAHGAPEDAVAVVVPRRMFAGDTPTQVLCSAVLIAEQALLTAGHCVDDYGRGTLEVHFGPDLETTTHARLVAQTTLHPEYSHASSAADLAVLWLDEPVTIAPLTIGAITAVLPNDLGLEAIGFSTGQRRTARVAIEQTDEHTIAYRPAPDMTCRGDSGGPLLAEIDGSPQIVGVTSAGDLACDTWGMAARVDAAMVERLSRAPERTEAPIDAAELCSTPCSHDDQCPSDLSCTDEGRCEIRGLEPGNLTEPCVDSSDCDSGLCVAMGASARCLDPCAGTAEGVVDPGAGCRLAFTDRPDGRPRAGQLGWLALVAGWLAVRRRRSPPREPERPPSFG